MDSKTSLFTFPQALRYRQFRLFWSGYITSVAGRRMQLTIVLWHIRQIDDQPILLGSIGLIQFLPILILGLLAGATADVANRRGLLIFTSLGSSILCLVLGLIELSGHVSVWIIYLIVLIGSAIDAFDVPAKSSLVPNIVPNIDLPNAYSLLTIAFQLGSIFGPGLAGIIMGGPGIGYAYLANGIVYLLVILQLIMMGAVSQQLELREKNIIRISTLTEGLRFVFRHPLILPGMLLDFFATLFASATVLLPIFATDILAVGAVGYSWLLAARSIGGSSSSLLLSLINKVNRQGRLLLGACLAFGLSTIIFGISRSYWLTFLALTIIGGSDALSAVIRETIRQSQTPDKLRGRMTSVNQIFFSGGPQLGELRAGLTAQWFGSPLAVIGGGILCIFATLTIGALYPKLVAYDSCKPDTDGALLTPF